MRRLLLSALPPLLILLLVSLTGCITITNSIPASSPATAASVQAVPVQTASAMAGTQGCCAAHGGHCAMMTGGYPMYEPAPVYDGNGRPFYYPWPWYFPQGGDARYVIIDERGNARSTSASASSGTPRSSDPILGGTSGTKTTAQVRRQQPRSDSSSSMLGGARSRDRNRTVSAPSSGDAVVVSQPDRNTSVDASGGRVEARPRGDVNREASTRGGDVVVAPTPRDVNREVEARTGGQVKSRSIGDVKRETTATNNGAVVVAPAPKPSRADSGAKSTSRTTSAPREGDMMRPAGNDGKKADAGAIRSSTVESNAPQETVEPATNDAGMSNASVAEPERAED